MTPKMTPFTITETDLSPSLKLLSKGKVRDLYEIDEQSILFIATDRVSAFDVVLENGIPDKGVLLTQLTHHWLSVLSKKLPDLKTHFISLDVPNSLVNTSDAAIVAGRSMQVQKLKVLPIESIVRGYITGSAWSEYKKLGTVHGMSMPAGLQESQILDEPMWTPSTKADVGGKDENITPDHAAKIIGKENVDNVAALSLELYKAAQDYAAERNIIIADTKFEFGLDESTTPPSVVLIDEVLTPDSSRFWDASKYQIGNSQPSLDKQYLRDWLSQSGLKGKEGAKMPQDVVERTRAGYVEAYERLTGTKWQPLRILLVGNGGREHALAWKLIQSPIVAHIFVCPGNGGTTSMQKTTNVSHISASSFQDLVAFAKQNNINLVIPGPEQPLVDGIVDYFHEHAPDVKCFGPTSNAARMEGSKAFSKDFMKRHNIPTARYESFTNFDDAKSYLDSVDFKVVIKADGLAAGKGVLIPANKEEAHAGLREMMLEKAFGNAGSLVVIEEHLDGHEISILSFCDGVTIKSLPPAQDHKRIFDNDQGPNTGGMGTYAPAPNHIVDQTILAEIEKTVLRPTIDGMNKEGFPFIGCLFTGYMITANGPKLLEYNVRFGDPETQSLLPLLQSDLAKILLACTNKTLADTEVKIISNFAATIVVAAPGYPGAYQKGIVINLDKVTGKNITLFHAGTTTTRVGDQDTLLQTCGGRVIAATATGISLNEAIEKAYAGVDCIHFNGMQYRKDIGARALR